MKNGLNKQKKFILRSILLWGLWSSFAFAQSGPASLNLSGGLYNSNGTAVLSTHVNFKIQIYDKGGTCLLYTEQHLGQDLSQTKGAFSLQIGSGTSQVNNVDLSVNFNNKVFQNPGGVVTVAGCAGGVTLATGDDRLVRVSYDLGSGFVTMTPDVPVTSAPYAMVAETLQGKVPADFIQAHNDVNNELTQVNAEYVFSTLKYPNLKALVDGTSSQYIVSAPTAPVSFNSQRLTSVSDPNSAQDASTKNYSDTNLGGKTLDVSGVGIGVGGGKTLLWDQVAGKWYTATSSGTVSSVSSGNGLTGGPITSAGTLSVDVGVTANKILQLNSLAQIPGVDGSLLTNLNATRLGTRFVASTSPTVGQILGWNQTTAQWEPQTSPAITSLTGDVVAAGPGSAAATIQPNAVTSAKINNTGNVVNRLLITDATTGSTVTYAVCGLGEVLSWSASGWACASVNTFLGTSGVVAGTYGSSTLVPQVSVDAQGRVTSLTNINIAFPVVSVAGRTGNVVLNAVDISGLGTAATKDVGIGSGNVVQLNGSSQIPAVDGSLLANINAVQLQSRNVASTAPTAGQVLGWNNTTTRWEPISAAVGSVTSVGSGNGLLGGPITGSGVLSVDVGTAANKILQLNTAAQIPAVDASLLTNVNATKIGTRTIATTAPSGGQFIGWNTTTAQWEPMATLSGTVTNVGSGTGLLGGPITSNGTISVDVGTTANKILQLTTTAQIPAIDGNLVSNVNSVKLQTRNVAATAPTSGQVLSWNTTTAQWEPSSVTSGTVTQVNTSTGLLGGPISSNGTLSVDVGTAANKILQLNTAAQIPAVDGSLLTNVNASKIGTRTIATTAPSGGQFIGWNTTAAQWEPMATLTGTVTNVSTSTGLLGGPVTSNGTISVDVGTAANKILQLTTTAQIPAVDGFLVTNINAVKLQGRNLAATPPANGQMVGWNSTTSQWEPMSAGVGSVLSVGSGTGLTGGPITSSGTLNVDVGTTANKILQLNTAALIPAVDGSLVTNVNAAKIGTRAIATTAPGAGQFVGWNTTTAQWEPMATLSGTVTNVSTSTGLLGGPVTSNGTLSVDVGTAANKILQLTTTAQIPAVDGNLISNVNAVKLQARNVAATAPTGGQVLGWNTTTAQWEPSTVTSGTVTQVNTSTGLLGGPISANGTLSVDVGTTANKILQLTTAGLVPAVDGSLLTNLNASRIATRTVAATAPTNGQILTWNTTTTQWEPQTNAVATGFINGGNTFGANSSLGNKDNFKLGFLTNNTTAMTIDTAGNVGIGTSNPQAGLDVATTGTAGSAIIVPRDSSANRPTTAVNGMIRYNTTNSKLEGYVNGTWQDFSTAVSGTNYLATTGGSLSGALTVSAGGESLTGGLDNNSGGITNAGNITGVGTTLTGSGALTVAAGGANQNLTLSGSGTGNVILTPNVGIGTTNPGSALNIEGGDLTIRTASTQAQIFMGRDASVNTYPGIWFGNAAATHTTSNFTFLYDQGTTGSVVNTPAGGYVQFRVGNDSANGVVLDSSKNLVVGGAYNSSGAQKLDVRGGATFSGNVGVGTTGPTTKLQVAGEISPTADNTYTLGDASLRFTAVYAVNGAIQTSDRREKTNIQSSDLGLDFINSLNPVSYYWKQGDGDLHYGLIAQDTEQAIKDAKTQAGSKVNEDEHVIVDHDPKSDRYGLRYTELLSPVIKAIQELYRSLTGTQADVATLKTENAAKTRDIASIKAENEKLKQENAQIKQDAILRAKENAELKARMDRIEKMLKSK